MALTEIKSNTDVYWENSKDILNNNFSYLDGKRTFGTGSNYSEFEADGTLVHKGSSTTWRDVDFPIVIRTTGPNIPVLTTVQGNITAPQWVVNDYNVCEGQELIHGWKEGSDIQWHAHVLTNGLDGTNRYLKFEVEWMWANTNGVLSSTQILTSTDLLIPANTPSKTHLSMQLGTSTMTGVGIAAHLWARLKRIASSGTAPTNNPWCSMLQVHIECDMEGSRTALSK